MSYPFVTLVQEGKKTVQSVNTDPFKRDIIKIMWHDGRASFHVHHNNAWRRNKVL